MGEWWDGGELTVGRGGVQDVKVSETVRLCYCCPLEGRVRPHPTLPHPLRTDFSRCRYLTIQVVDLPMLTFMRASCMYVHWR